MPFCGCYSVAVSAVSAACLAFVYLSGSQLPLLYINQKENILEETILEEHFIESIINHYPPLDIFITGGLLLLGCIIFIFERIHMKLTERRLAKVNRCLQRPIDELKEFERQQEHLDSALKMVQNATSEYNLLLYLLIRQNNGLSLDSNYASAYDGDIFDDNFILAYKESTS